MYSSARKMSLGKSASVSMRAGALAAIAIPLMLLVGVFVTAGHGDHADERECAVCHSGQQSADLAWPLELVSPHAVNPVEPEGETRRVASRRSVRQPARAPPA